MIDRTLPVMLRLNHNGHDSLCLARLRVDAGRLFAEPYKPARGEQPYRPDLIEIDERRLEIDADEHVARPIYRYTGVLIVS